MSTWIDEHFKLPTAPQRLPVERHPTRGRWAVPFVVSLTLLVLVIGGTWFKRQRGHATAPVSVVTSLPTIDRSEVLSAPSAALSAPPTMTITYVAELREDDVQVPDQEHDRAAAANAARTVMTPAHVEQLQRLVRSRRSGLALLERDRAIALQRLAAAEALLRSASRRLGDFERARMPSTSSRAVYEWQILHEDALSATRSATQEVKRYQRVVASFDERLAQTRQELSAAEAAWDAIQPDTIARTGENANPSVPDSR